MRAVSDRFLNALRGSHKMRARATVLTSFQEGTTPTGTEIPVLGGDVRFSASSDIRATLELTTDGKAWDHAAGQLLTPYGNEVFIERGIEYGDGAVEWVSLGYYRIYDVEQDDVPDGPIRIFGRDRMSLVIDSKLEAPWDPYIGGPPSVSQVFNALITFELDMDIQGVYPDATIEYDDSTFANSIVERAGVVERDRHPYLRDLVRAAGKIMYWDYAGKLQVKDAPDPTTPVWTVDAGKHGVLINMSRALGREGIYNAWVVTGEAADDRPPVRAVVRDVNPDSPTYYYGDFGPMPGFYSSPHITTKAQAAIAATALFRQHNGRPAVVDFSAVPNPALEPLDPVQLKPRSIELHVLDDITVPLTGDAPLTSTTRTQTGEEFEAGLFTATQS